MVSANRGFEQLAFGVTAPRLVINDVIEHSD